MPLSGDREEMRIRNIHLSPVDDHPLRLKSVALTLPQLLLVGYVATIIAVIGSLGNFYLISVMTQGEPDCSCISEVNSQFANQY